MEFDVDGWNICTHCRGEKIIRNRSNPSLSEICPTCGGYGGRDWVSNAMDRRDEIDTNLHHKVCYQNIQILQQQMIEEGFKAGMRLDIQIRPVEQYHSFSMQSVGSHVHSAVDRGQYYASYPILGPPKDKD